MHVTESPSLAPSPAPALVRPEPPKKNFVAIVGDRWEEQVRKGPWSRRCHTSMCSVPPPHLFWAGVAALRLDGGRVAD